MTKDEVRGRAMFAALAIGGDIMDRRGLSEKWEQMGPAMQREIIEEWAETIATAMTFDEADS